MRSRLKIYFVGSLLTATGEATDALACPIDPSNDPTNSGSIRHSPKDDYRYEDVPPMKS
jgi:hypothetical protein